MASSPKDPAGVHSLLIFLPHSFFCKSFRILSMCKTVIQDHNYNNNANNPFKYREGCTCGKEYINPIYRPYQQCEQKRYQKSQWYRPCTAWPRAEPGFVRKHSMIKDRNTHYCSENSDRKHNILSPPCFRKHQYKIWQY